MEGLSKKCAAITRFGEPCKKDAIKDQDYCTVHHPAHAKSHRERSREGGRQKLNRTAPLDISDLDPTTLDGLKGVLGRALERLGRLNFDSKVANAIAVLAREQRSILQDSEFERRLAALEETADELKDSSEPWR
ncbi:MAG: hypothetical protein JSV86_00265 [Gemmatimonadota bacterium]|nr:MAG: hypothetical protein JSV86_00265 [Gemmatimonadota bacterium]